MVAPRDESHVNFPFTFAKITNLSFDSDLWNESNQKADEVDEQIGNRHEFWMPYAKPTNPENYPNASKSDCEDANDAVLYGCKLVNQSASIWM